MLGEGGAGGAGEVVVAEERPVVARVEPGQSAIVAISKNTDCSRQIDTHCILLAKQFHFAFFVLSGWKLLQNAAKPWKSSSQQWKLSPVGSKLMANEPDGGGEGGEADEDKEDPKSLHFALPKRPTQIWMSEMERAHLWEQGGGGGGRRHAYCMSFSERIGR